MFAQAQSVKGIRRETCSLMDAGTNATPVAEVGLSAFYPNRKLLAYEVVQFQSKTGGQR